MDAQVEDFNWNLRLFLDVLTRYQTKVNKANPATLELLEKTLDSISDLIGNVEEIPGQGDAIVCSFDENNFQIKRTIFCRLCKVDVAASRLGYMLHCADSKHHAKLIDLRQPQGNVLSQNGVFDTNNNSKGDHVDLWANKTTSPNKQHPGNHPNVTPSTKEANNTSNNCYVSSMGGLLASLDARRKSDAVQKNDLKVTNNDKNSNGPNKAAPAIIPNVFDDNIYDFIESIGKQTNPSKVNEPSKVIEPPMANSIKTINNGAPTEKISLQSDQASIFRQNSLLSWRERSLNDSIPSKSHVDHWRAKPDGPNAAASLTSTPVTDTASKASASATTQKSAATAKVPLTPVTESIIQSGAVLSGSGVKPCATYELNNLYLKFPHLNPNKVVNPLKPVPLRDAKQPTNKDGQAQKMSDAKLKEFFDRVNKEHAKKFQQKSIPTQLKKSELTNSLMSLPAFLNNNSSASVEQKTVNRMPPRSASSLNLTGITRIEGSNPQRAGSRKSSPQVNNQNGNNRNQNANGKAKSTQNQNGSASSTPNDPKSKGAIPKQKNTPQATPSNQKRINDSSKTSQNSQKKDVNEVLKVIEKQPVQKLDLATLVNHEQLKKFFSGDLSALISLMVSFNMRRDKPANQQKLIESIENMLKTKFQTMKCHMIGSHVYNVAKGGLATSDFYLDLHNSFHTDKSGSVFVSGMNTVQNLLKQSNGEWADINCSEQTRYGIVSATFIETKQKCTFSFGTGVVVRNTEVINSLFTAQPVARQMVICVRLALQEGAFGDWAKLFNGYIVTLLVIFYLQIAGKLPSVLSLQSDPNLELVKCGENLVQFANPTNVTICKDRIRELLIGFFDYYANFDFFNKIISPFEGREINQNFRNCPVDSLSRSMRRFKNLIDTEAQRWTNNRMCIQDIFEHKRNAAQAIHAKEVKAFADFCSKALYAIREAGNAVKY